MPEITLTVSAKVYRKRAEDDGLYVSGRILPEGSQVAIGDQVKLHYGDREVLTVPARAANLCGDHFYLLVEDLKILGAVK